MTARPGVIKEIIDVPIPREKRFNEDVKFTPEFVEVRRELWELIKEEVIKSQETSNKVTIEEFNFGDEKKIEEVNQ